MLGGAVQAGIASRFKAIDLVDSSVITLPNSLADTWRGSGGSGGEKAREAGLKLSVRWDVLHGQLKHLDISDSLVHDRQASAHHSPVAAGSLQLRDLGYFKLDDLKKIDQQGAYWLLKYKVGTWLMDETQQALDLRQWLPQQVGQRLDTWVWVGQKKRLPACLIAERVPAAVVRQRHDRMRELARRKQTPPAAQSLALAHWSIYLTNVSSQQLTPDEVFVLGRYRWQIELLFKLWKSDLHLDEWRTTNPARILCELYAKLIAAIVTHWFLLIGCWHHSRRSLRQAMPAIHGFAWQWANSLTCLPLLIHTLQALRRSLSHCFMDRSRQSPRAFQLLEANFA